MNYNR